MSKGFLRFDMFKQQRQDSSDSLKSSKSLSSKPSSAAPSRSHSIQSEPVDVAPTPGTISYPSHKPANHYILTTIQWPQPPSAPRLPAIGASAVSLTKRRRSAVAIARMSRTVLPSPLLASIPAASAVARELALTSRVAGDKCDS